LYLGSLSRVGRSEVEPDAVERFEVESDVVGISRVRITGFEAITPPLWSSSIGLFWADFICGAITSSQAARNSSDGGIIGGLG